MAQVMPVLLGADMNCYSMARAFHEAYGVVSHAFGRWPMGETKYTRIVKFTAVENFDTDEVMLATLRAFAAQHPGEKKIVLGCTDDYAALIIRNGEALRQDYIVPYIGKDLMDKLVSKESFYQLCEAYGIPYPKTLIVHGTRDAEKLAGIDFAYPIIVKPSSSILYWKYPFDGMKKVYVAETAEDAREIIQTIYASGYPDSLIIQDLIPGDDDGMRVLTAYCDRHAKVKMVCLGNVLLEEHTPKGLGNHAAILTEYNRPLMDRLAAFLEAVGYTGFANFDIKLDPRDGSYRVFEINLRQGRSNYYVTGAGVNLARLLVEDRVEEKEPGEPVFFNGESYWHSIPNKIVWEYTGDYALVKKAQAIAAAGRDTTALDYAYDLKGNLLRRLYLWEHYRRYQKKYDTYCIKPVR